MDETITPTGSEAGGATRDLQAEWRASQAYMATDEWRLKNARRCGLLGQESRSEAEDAELDDLNARLDELLKPADEMRMAHLLKFQQLVEALPEPPKF